MGLTQLIVSQFTVLSFFLCSFTKRGFVNSLSYGSNCSFTDALKRKEGDSESKPSASRFLRKCLSNNARSVVRGSPLNLPCGILCTAPLVTCAATQILCHFFEAEMLDSMFQRWAIKLNKENVYKLHWSMPVTLTITFKGIKIHQPFRSQRCLKSRRIPNSICKIFKYE